MLKSGAIFVTFRPTDEQVAAIAATARLFDAVIVVDNSPATDATLHHRFNLPNIQFLENANRGGIAGAFNRGVEALLAGGIDRVYFFDQDSAVPSDYRQLMDEALDSAPEACMIGPKIYDINLRAFSPRYLVSRWTYRADPIPESASALIPCSFLISSGSVATRAALTACGPFREDYFIDDVDTEYCLRAALLGVGVFINPRAVLNHAIGEREEHRFLGVRIRPSHHGALRRYYRCRNGISLSLRHARHSPAFLIHNQKRLAHEMIGVLLYERRKCKKLTAIGVGIIHGITSRLGDLREIAPRFHRWLVG
ncbi:glycosyltransferase family 2 protein [Ralstonia solanacearum]|uniref:glycosyltransferase family 2 protein n=1 Tax=Ralstonia solanacearum TaxID=305 RepID=UPI0012A0EC85|nr:glycosyltransferase family 2 protein [Ralstonia solanacearum]AST31340.2 glycosyltransferase family 2 protein [Ralstonia solanacearum]AYB52320.2 glycosyltransferase family 2 protein [Ralstonia solanacearum]AYB56880.1 glycosyltransferase family 2 protein [Ralstonia solanacearum]MDB0508351.1 glycosyltransferase family 2 protein [Ralstonia solanacearum]MDB0513616.1 glycosyltransferase family 2 protein [Ralstonia solanacearum]